MDEVKQKPWYLSKTLWANAIVVVVSLLAYVASEQFPIDLGPDVIYVVTFIIGIMNLVLRFLTDSALTLKK